MPRLRLGLFAAAPFAVLLIGGCSTIGSFLGGSEPETTAATGADASAEQIDVRRYLGPDYCPEMRLQEGTQLVRKYERGHEDDPAFVIWQASVGKTARECLYDQSGNLTLRIGITGRVIAGPKGGPGAVEVPLRVAVVKFQEATLASEFYPLSVTIPSSNSTAFTEVREITVPSPGQDRDYIIYVGLAESESALLNPGGEPAVAVVEEPPPPLPAVPPPAPASPPAPQPTPNVLPTPTDFVLPGN